MLDPRVAPEGLPKQPPMRPALVPGSPNWRARWLAAVRLRMSVEPARAARMRMSRVKALGSDPTLWADLRAAEGAYARGEGEFFVPGAGATGAGR